MTVLMCWKLSAATSATLDDASSSTASIQSSSRSVYFFDQVIGGGAGSSNASSTPDIIVIYGIKSRTGCPGTQGYLCPANTDQGSLSLYMLTTLRSIYGQAWCLVPPIFLGDLGKREVAAVYYNSTNLEFLGPNILTSQKSQGSLTYASSPAVGSSSVPYPGPWETCLPPSSADPQRGTVPENCRAGQWAYAAAGGTAIGFPTAGDRPPYFTSFSDKTDSAGRTINLFTMHASAEAASAALARLSNCVELSKGSADAVNVLVGGFNQDPYADDTPYGWLLTAGYKRGLDPEYDGQISAVRMPYVMTRLLPAEVATPCGVPPGGDPSPTGNVYPRYGYMGGMSSGPDGAPTDQGVVDNVFTLYGTAVNGAASDVTIVNTVVGKPYLADPDQAEITSDLTGGLTYPSSLAQGVPAGGLPSGETSPFQAWQNFGRIVSTSRHLALSVTV